MKSSFANGLVRVVASLLFASIVNLTIRFGHDFDAWRTAASHVDCSLLTLALFGLPLLLVLDRVTGVLPRGRWVGRVAVVLLPLLFASTAIFDPQPFRHVFNAAPPANTRLKSARYFTSAAGGGEEYSTVQFELDPVEFNALMSRSGFAVSPGTPPPSLDKTYNRDGFFRHPIPAIASPEIYTKSYGLGDEATVIWDPANATAHARRVHG